MDGRRSGRRPGLAVRLFAAQVLVLITAAVTLSVVATTVGPSLFHTHLRRAVGEVSADTSRHVEQAYTYANALALTLALIAALAAATAVSAYVARRVARPAQDVAAASLRLASGQYAVRVAAPGLGAEFDTLTTVFNQLAERLQAVESTRSRLLADLGHELRTPVATLEAYLDAAEDGVSVADEDTLTVLRTQIARLRRLADDVRAVSRAEEDQLPLRPQSLDIAAVVGAAAAAARPRFHAKGVELRQRCDPRATEVEVDPQRFGQVLANLLDNALRHTPPGGRVEVVATGRDGRVDIAVADTGVGIAAEHLPHLFERFYRVDTARDTGHGGSGIGLAIVRAVTIAHGGQVRAESPGAGRGATFTVTLPVATGAGRAGGVFGEPVGPTA
jgi:two-component system sensor histidine kinase BaeS